MFNFTQEQINDALERAKRLTPTEMPGDLLSACKCEPIDPAWPVQDPIDALHVLHAWDILNGKEGTTNSHRLTHSHHYESLDLARMGVTRLYRESDTTKYVSVAWHLAGRYTYDETLIKELDRLGWPKLKMVDFGAAPWIQSIFYTKKGLDVTAVNQSIDSDTHQFGKFLAHIRGASGIKEAASDDPWDAEQYDIIYAIDVLEHIPPLPDGSMGWVPYAERLLKALKPGGLWYVNAPFGISDGPIRPVDTHQVHYTSPIRIEDWALAHGLVQDLYLWKKPL